MKPIVYFSREITPEKVLELYRALGKARFPARWRSRCTPARRATRTFCTPNSGRAMVDAVNGTDRRVQHGV